MSEYFSYFLSATAFTIGSIIGGTYMYYCNPKSIEALLEVDAFRNVAMYIHDCFKPNDKETKDDNKIRIRYGGEYEYNGKTYVMPEDFWHHSDFSKQSLLKLDDNQIRMHYINVEFDGKFVMNESSMKDMLDIINYFAGIDGLFYTNEKFNIKDKTPNNMFGELEADGLIDKLTHIIKITSNFGEVFTLKRGYHIQIDSQMI